MPETKYFEKEIALSPQSEPAGEKFPAKLAYWTFGDVSNPAVFMPTCYGGSLETTSPYLYNTDFWPEPLFNPSKYFVIIAGLLAGGESSSPSNTPAPWNGPNFPHTTYEDNIRLQYALCESLGVKKLFAYIGFSMGGQQAYHISTLYPDFVENMVCLAGSAKTSWHNWCFLEGPKHALTHSIDFEGGHYKDQAHQGLKAFARVYSTWALSQDWFRQRCWEQLGFKSLQEFLDAYWSGSGDANDRLALLWTWQQGDIGLYHPEDNGDLAKTLGRIKANCLIMPSATDQYFPPEDNQEEVKHLKHGTFKSIPTVWGHLAGGGGSVKEDREFVVKEIKHFLNLFAQAITDLDLFLDHAIFVRIARIGQCKTASPDPNTLNAGTASLDIEELDGATHDDQKEDHITTPDGELAVPEPSTDQHPAHDPFAISVGALRALNRTRRAAGLSPLSVEDVEELEELEERGEEENHLEALQAEKRETWKARRQEQRTKQQARKQTKKQAKKAKHEQMLSQKRAEKQALREQKKQEMEAELEEKHAVRAQLAEERAQSTKEAAIVTLVGSTYSDLKHGVLKDKIFKAIADNLTVNPNLASKGRTNDFFRINFDPTAQDITSVRSRLSQILPEESQTEIDYAALDRLLCNFVLQNRTYFNIPPGTVRTGAGLRGSDFDERSYRSTWIYNQKLFREHHPVTLSKRDTVISAVVQAMSEKCRRVDPDSLLLVSPYVNFGGQEETEHRRQWGLSSLYSGLAARIRECFGGAEVHSEVYEDRVEQVLYSYKIANKTAIYGTKKDEESG